jgi:hypothetical protein
MREKLRLRVFENRVLRRRMRWAVHAARMVRRGDFTGFWWGSLRERTAEETQA